MTITQDQAMALIRGQIPETWDRLALSPGREQEFRQWARRSPHTAHLSHVTGMSPAAIAAGIVHGPRDGAFPDYDYRRMWAEQSPMAFDPSDGTYHGYSVAPSGEWLKNPTHPTAWMEAALQASQGAVGRPIWPQRSLPHTSRLLADAMNKLGVGLPDGMRMGR